MSIEAEVYSPPEPVEFEQAYTGFPEPVYSLPLNMGWESPVTFEPLVQPVPQIQPLEKITEITKVVETIYQEAEPLPQMEFQAAAPETYGSMGYFAVLLAILMFGFAPTQEEML